MTLAITVKCDNPKCLTEEVIHTTVGKIEDAIITPTLPQDWRLVFVDFGNIGGRGQGHVCSMKCSYEWMVQQLASTERYMALHGEVRDGRR